MQKGYKVRVGTIQDGLFSVYFDDEQSARKVADEYERDGFHVEFIDESEGVISKKEL